MEAKKKELYDADRKKKRLPPPSYSPSTHKYVYKYLHTRIRWHSEGSFYGPHVPTNEEFGRYAAEFSAVELNATFYRIFPPSAFDAWRDKALAARPGFKFAVKANQFFTHRKRLIVDDVFREVWGRFWEACQHLGPCLGPVLFQFPDTFKTTSRGGAVDNVARLEALAALLPRNGRFAFEFRESSWFACPRVRQIFHANDWCLAVVEARPEETLTPSERAWCGDLCGAHPRPEDYPAWRCSWGVYLRFHGSRGKYVGAYGAEVAREWAERVAAWLGPQSGANEVEGPAGGPSTSTFTKPAASASASVGPQEAWMMFNNTDDAVRGTTTPCAIADSRYTVAALRDLGILTVPEAGGEAPLSTPQRATQRPVRTRRRRAGGEGT
jgi:uncharacterized protein YecE (DUF72 family)